jgi:hypothetical protein
MVISSKIYDAQKREVFVSYELLEFFGGFERTLFIVSPVSNFNFVLRIFWYAS